MKAGNPGNKFWSVRWLIATTFRVLSIHESLSSRESAQAGDHAGKRETRERSARLRTVRFPEARYWITIVNEEIHRLVGKRGERWKSVECRSPLLLWAGKPREIEVYSPRAQTIPYFRTGGISTGAESMRSSWEAYDVFVLTIRSAREETLREFAVPLLSTHQLDDTSSHSRSSWFKMLIQSTSGSPTGFLRSISDFNKSFFFFSFSFSTLLDVYGGIPKTEKKRRLTYPSKMQFKIHFKMFLWDAFRLRLSVWKITRW